MTDKVILITYTTRYRDGGDKFQRAARTLAKEKTTDTGHRVVCRPTESKAEFKKAIEEATINGDLLRELHFVGHSGMYGIMFGTTKWPEQFSPHEWQELTIPFASDAEAYFHACRTARWFAPFFARTFSVKSHGYHWYTSISMERDRFRWDSFSLSQDTPLFIISCDGRKSHGLLGSLRKYSGLAKVYPMQTFEASEAAPDSTYDSVAGLYDNVFTDFSVRKDEWEWFRSKVPSLSGKTVLDIGCGNGVFLGAIAKEIERGVGVDISQAMIAKARERVGSHHSNLRFEKIDGPQLPFAGQSFDLVTSVLSFRYLDWDPIMSEILRVLKPGGSIVVIDMVAAPVKLKETPQLIKAKVLGITQRTSNRPFREALIRMVENKNWRQMVEHNPIREQHEMKWYLESRFPGRVLEPINLGWNARTLGFYSGAVTARDLPKLTYP